MAKISSREKLSEYKNNMLHGASAYVSGDCEKTIIYVGMATCGSAAGAGDVYSVLVDEVKSNNLNDVLVVPTGCVGLCFLEPLVEIKKPGEESVYGCGIDANKARRLVSEYVKKDVLTDCMRPNKGNGKQVRIALRNCGVINPEKIEDYVASGGYEALAKAMFELKPEGVINEMKKSMLRGRGGAGFPTGLKWEYGLNSKNEKKYVICNADEGDPGAFMDRSILEGDPHSVLEAMAIAGFAIGADEGIIYIRAEYPLAVKRLKAAINQAEKLGLLGTDILGSGFNFSISLSLGAGAFVCGEETALLNSLEGKRGEPRLRPPYPAEKGLWDKPTVINNVETYANVAAVISRGADWFTGIGTEKSPGTKVFALAGKINNVGLIEVPMGTTLREIVYDIGGGIPDGKAFKAIQTGGPSGGVIPSRHIDMGVDYESLASIGSMMGSGGMIIMDEDDCMVNIAKFYLDFTIEESCGKCTPCRVGTTRLYEILERVARGEGVEEDLAKLKELGQIIKTTSLCGLGNSAPNPVLSTVNFFRDEYVTHVRDKKCPAKACRELLSYSIIPEKCVGCTLCAKVCPTDCIIGELRQVHSIDGERCIKCGACLEKCAKHGAIVVE